MSLSAEQVPEKLGSTVATIAEKLAANQAVLAAAKASASDMQREVEAMLSDEDDDEERGDDGRGHADKDAAGAVEMPALSAGASSAASASAAPGAISKRSFSMLVPVVMARLQAQAAEARASAGAPSSADRSLAGLQVALCGIEAHVCVQQTARDLAAAGADVVVVSDAVSSSRSGERSAALRGMAAGGCRVVSAEALAFELLGSAAHPEFRSVSRLVKARASELGAADDELLMLA